MTSGQVALITGRPRAERVVLDRAGDAVRAEDGHRVGGHLGQILDETRALGLQAFDHVLVVHDLVPHVDRRAIFLQRALDDLDGAHDAGAESAWLSQNDPHQR